MSLKIDKPVTVAANHTITFDSLHIMGGAQDQLRAVVTFAVADEKGRPLAPRNLVYTGDDFNAFWAEFDSGKFLYDQLVAREKLPVKVTSAVENDFLNPSPSEK